MNQIAKELKNKILLFGLPFDRVLKNELETRIEELIARYPTDKTPKFLTALRTLNLSETGSIFQGQDPLSEGTKALLNASFIGLKSTPLSIFAKLLGNSLNEQISPLDLFLATVSLLAKNKESVFLVGGDSTQNQAIEKALQEDFPKLKIVGSSSQEIITKGKKIHESMERDNFLIDHIHSKKPLVLVIQLGHPKQEIWFERVKHMLQVPLVVGVGGAFDHYLKMRDDESETKKNFSFGQEKIRLKSIAYFALRFPLLFLYHSLNRLLFSLSTAKNQKDEEKTLLFISGSKAFSLVKLPSYISKQTFTRQKNWIDEVFEYDTMIFDMKSVSHIDLSGLGYLMQLKLLAERERKNLLFLGLSKDLEWLFRLHGVFPYFGMNLVQTPLEALSRAQFASLFSDEEEFASIHQVEHDTVITFFGQILGKEEGALSLKQLEPLLKERGCKIDLTYAEAITSHGALFLINLKRHQERQDEPFVLTHMGKTLKRQFKELHLLDLFLIED